MWFVCILQRCVRICQDVDEDGEKHNIQLENFYNRHLTKGIDTLLIDVSIGDTVVFKGYKYFVEGIIDIENEQA
jgi:hypothetical protein